MTTTYTVSYTTPKGRKETRQIGGTDILTAERAIRECKILEPEATGFSAVVTKVGGDPIKKLPLTKLELRMEAFLAQFRTPELAEAMGTEFGLSARVDIAGPRTSEGACLGAVLHEPMPVAGYFSYHVSTPAEAIALIARLRADRAKWVRASQ